MSVRMVLRLARRFTRRRDVLLGLVLIALPIALLLGLRGTTTAFTLSAEQRIARDMGRFDGWGQFAGINGPIQDTDTGRRIARLAERFPRAHATVMLASDSLRPDRNPRNSRLFLTETDWRARPFPDRYRLLGGRWPARPGEVVVIGDAAQFQNARRQIRASSGHVTLAVVGRASDVYQSEASAALAAPGTWAALDWPTLRREGFRLDALVQVLGNFPDWDAVHRSSVASLGAGSGAQFTLTRAMIRQKPAKTWVERRPTLYTAPAAALALALVALLFGLRTRAARRRQSVLRAIGVPPGAAITAVLLGTTALVTMAILVAGPLGIGFTALGRLVAERLADQPLNQDSSTWTGYTQLAGLVGIASGASIVASWLVFRRLRGLNTVRVPRRSLATTGNYVRRGASVAAALGVASLMPGSTMAESGERIVWLSTLAILLLLPDLLRIFRNLPLALPSWLRLAGRRLASSPVRNLAVWATIMAIIGPVMVNMSTHATTNEAERRAWGFGLPPAQYAITSGDGMSQGPADSRAAGIAAGVHGRKPIQLQSTYQRGQGPGPGAGYIVAQPGRSLDLGSALIAVRSSRELQALLGPAFTPRAGQVVGQGGVVVFSRAQRTYRAPLLLRGQPRGASETSPKETLRTAGPVQVMTIPPDQAWSDQTTGFILATTAGSLGVELSRGWAVFSDARPGEQEEVAEQLRLNGLPTDSLELRREFEYIPRSGALRIGPYALLGLLLLVSWLALWRSARSLKNDSRLLLAIGMPPRWARRVLFAESGIVMSVGVVSGLLVAGAVGAIMLVRFPSLPLVVPVRECLALLAAMAGVVISATWFAARS